MYKIKTILPYNTHKLLESYLYDRKCVVRCNTAISDDFTVGARVPQGSVLGPTLYTRLKTSTFADDTAILSRSKSPMQARS